MKDKVLEIIEQKGLLDAIEFLSSQEDLPTIAKTFNDLIFHFYDNHKDIRKMTQIGEAGIGFCLTKGDSLSSANPEMAHRMKRAARAISYNLSCNLWPGWNAPGIELSEADIQICLAAAKIHVKLVQDLKEESPVQMNAFWLLGAALLANKQYQDASVAFYNQHKLAVQDEDAMSKWLALGYAGITKLVEGSNRDVGQQEFNKAIMELAKIDNDDAEFFVDQLKTAHDYFMNC